MAIRSDEFKRVLKMFPAGVTIVTIRSGEQIHGLTISAFASLSPEPPLILIIVDQRHLAHDLLLTKGATFAVNILAEDQQELSDRFAWTKDEDRFAAGDWDVAETGAPILEDALAWMDCVVHSSHSTETHTMFLGEVMASSVTRPADKPLIYWNRDYRTLADGVVD